MPIFERLSLLRQSRNCWCPLILERSCCTFVYLIIHGYFPKHDSTEDGTGRLVSDFLDQIVFSLYQVEQCGLINRIFHLFLSETCSVCTNQYLPLSVT